MRNMPSNFGARPVLAAVTVTVLLRALMRKISSSDKGGHTSSSVRS